MIAAFPAVAADVSVVGIIGDKAAVLVIGGAEPRTVRVGQSLSGITLIGVTKQGATLQIDGKRRTLALGQHLRESAPGAGSTRTSVTLAADTRGHFVTDGQVNDLPVRFLVDTGATMISLSERDARRLGLDFSKGQRGSVKTANGIASAYRIKLDTVRVGGIELHNVDALVHTGSDLDVVLLGMSFLNRVEMQRAGDSLTLRKRF